MYKKYKILKRQQSANKWIKDANKNIFFEILLVEYLKKIRNEFMQDENERTENIQQYENRKENESKQLKKCRIKKK